MTSKAARIPDHFQAWIRARKRHHLSHAQVQMARELGMNPKTLGKLDNAIRGFGNHLRHTYDEMDLNAIERAVADLDRLDAACDRAIGRNDRLRDDAVENRIWMEFTADPSD